MSIPKLKVGQFYTSNCGFGKMEYIGTTHDIDGWLPTFRMRNGRTKAYSLDHLALKFEEFSVEQGPHPMPVDESCYGMIAPVPPAGDVPEYFVAACDKFDWTPEEALRFYAEGKHFDTVDGRTRILCTGAIASHALKGLAGPYADMKGIEPAGDMEVLGWIIQYQSVLPGITGQRLVQLNNPEPCSGNITELVDRSVVTRLTAELDAAVADFRLLSTENDRLLAENATLQSELTKARELFLALDDAWNSYDGRGRFGDFMKKVEQLNAQPATPITHNADESCGKDAECKYCGGDGYHATPRTPGTTCEACNGSGQDAEAAKGEPEPTCNEQRSEIGLPTNAECVHCGRGRCFDR